VLLSSVKKNPPNSGFKLAQTEYAISSSFDLAATQRMHTSIRAKGFKEHCNAIGTEFCRQQNKSVSTLQDQLEDTSNSNAFFQMTEVFHHIGDEHNRPARHTTYGPREIRRSKVMDLRNTQSSANLRKFMPIQVTRSTTTCNTSTKSNCLKLRQYINFIKRIFRFRS
jgi:hypothetical protein